MNQDAINAIGCLEEIRDEISEYVADDDACVGYDTYSHQRIDALNLAIRVLKGLYL